MATKYEYHDTDLGQSEFAFGNTVYETQTFTPSITHSITYVRIYARRVSGSPTDLTIDVKAVDGNGKPTGAALATGTVDASGWDTSNDWHTVTFDSETLLTAGTQYALVAYYTGVNQIAWSCQYPTPTYTDGEGFESLDSGSTWAGLGGGDYGDFHFEEWGDPVAPIDTDSAYDSVGGVFLLNDTGDVERDLTPYIISADGLPGSRELTDVTPLAAAGHVFLPDLENAKITLDLNWSDDALVGSDTVIGLLRKHTTAMTFKYGPRGSTTGYPKYSGVCSVRHFLATSKVGSQVGARCELQVNGQVTRGTF